MRENIRARFATLCICILNVMSQFANYQNYRSLLKSKKKERLRISLPDTKYFRKSCLAAGYLVKVFLFSKVALTCCS